MSASISETLKLYSIKLNVTAQKKEDALSEIVHTLNQSSHVQDVEAFYEEVMERERLESTCMNHEIAFPHARTDMVDDLVIAAGRSKEGVWFENANPNVKLVFVIGTPKRMVTEYLATVGALARILKEQHVRNKLMGAKTNEEFLHFLAEAE